MNEIHCPPLPKQPAADATILELAAYASDATNRYRDAMEQRAPFRETMRAAGALAAATERLTTAIADAVACGDSRLS